MTHNIKPSKIALVTGASSGMGKEIAKILIQDGLTVIVAARRVEKMDDLKRLGAHPIALDISSEASITDLVDEITKTYGGVDVLVNNAGFGLYGAIEDVPMEEARYQFDVNLFGLARLTQLLLPFMREKRAGKIINMSSMGGQVYTPLGGWYHASKHALEGWSDCLRIELSQFGIDVVVIQPGAIKTNFGDVMEDQLTKFSGVGAYKRLVQALVKSLAENFEKGGASSPQVITDLVSKAIKSNRPKTRYVAGRYAKPMLFIRKWFGDRIYDKAIMSVIN
jgi:short-subunit dehydrogenase